MKHNLDHAIVKGDECRKKFCERNRITDDDWGRAKIDWDMLVDIANDHCAQISSLSASAGMYAGIIQGISGVHSVRWRVKDPEHLISKIIRKKIEEKEAYQSIDVGNYFDIVTDLVGIRALHLFKDDFGPIHNELSPLLDDKEKPVANIRQGDPEGFSDLCRELGLEIKVHAAGYRSIHYVKTVKPLNRDLHVEIQLRTVFEEGWSEVDHRVRYPNFSGDPLVNYASLILNRLSGMADEMSTYAMQLSEALVEKTEKIETYQRERDDALLRIEQLISALDSVKQDNVATNASLDNLKQEVAKLKSANELEKEKREPGLVGSSALRGLSFSNLHATAVSQADRAISLSELAIRESQKRRSQPRDE